MALKAGKGVQQMKKGDTHYFVLIPFGSVEAAISGKETVAEKTGFCSDVIRCSESVKQLIRRVK